MKSRKLIRKHGMMFVAMAILLGFVSEAWSAPADYNGNYAGTFIGDDSGIWVAMVDSTHSLYAFLTYSAQRKEADEGEMILLDEDEINGIGHFRGRSDWESTLANVYITKADGSVDGTWDSQDETDSGDLVGTEVTSCPVTGYYYGHFSGGDSGTWEMAIAANCTLTGSMTFSGVESDFTGGAHPNGYVVFSGEDNYGDAFIGGGQISGIEISGTWKSENRNEGTFSIKDEDNEGTCFIQSVLKH